MVSDQKPRLTGRNLTALAVVAVVCLTALGLMAMHQGLDGAIFASVVGAICIVAGGAGGFSIARK